MKKVIIALDYDPSSRKVAEQGYALAKAMGAKVTLLHIITDQVYYSSVGYSSMMGFNNSMQLGSIQIDSIATVKKAAQHFLDKTKEHLADESIETVLNDGAISDSILDEAEKLNANIIVLGTHSRKWLDTILVGSVAESVLKNSTIPLFIIPFKNIED